MVYVELNRAPIPHPSILMLSAMICALMVLIAHPPPDAEKMVLLVSNKTHTNNVSDAFTLVERLGMA